MHMLMRYILPHLIIITINRKYTTPHVDFYDIFIYNIDIVMLNKSSTNTLGKHHRR